MIRHIGLAATLLIAVARLFLIHGVRIGGLLIFLVVPALAYLTATSGGVSRWTALVAESFLLLIGAGAVLASLDLLPAQFNEFPKLPRADNRLLSFYLFVYMVYVAGVIPPYALGRSLWQHRRGEQADLAPFICWLGLATWALIMVGAISAFWRWFHVGFGR